MATLHTEWLIPERVLYLQHEHLLTLEELQVWVSHIHHLMNQVSHQDRIHIVYDASAKGDFDRFLFDRQALRQTIAIHPQTGWIIVIMPDLNVFLSFLAQQMTRLFKLPVKIVAHLGDAYLLLQKIDHGCTGTHADHYAYETAFLPLQAENTMQN